jgi:SAM-dependent methyltransferase
MDTAGESDQYAVTADIYDYVIPYRTREDVQFFVEAARVSGGPVLELGCGTGRVLIPTARAGIEIVGIDSSPHMLQVCQKHLVCESKAVQQRVRLIQADMRGFEVDQAFPLVTLPFRPFQHLTTVEDQMSCLEAIRKHLGRGGRLILDLFNPSLKMLVEENLGKEFGDEPEFTIPDGRRVLRLQKIVARDYSTQTNQIELIYLITHADGRKERLVHAFPMRYLFRFEAEHLLVRCGFRVEDVYGDYDKSPFGPKHPAELILVASKA